MDKLTNQLRENLYELNKILNLVFDFLYIYRSSILFVIVAVLCILLVIFIRRRYSRWESQWLSTNIDLEIKRLNQEKNEKAKGKIPNFLRTWQSPLFLLKRTKDYFKNYFIAEVKNFSFPSPASLLLYLTIFLILFALSHNISYESLRSLVSWNRLRRPVDSADTSNLITIMAGIVSVVFSISIFITESIRDNKNVDQRRVLIRAGNLWTIVVFTTLSLVNFLWFKVNLLSLIFPVSLSILLIVSFWRTIRIFIDPSFREEFRKKLLKERVRKIMLESIRERIGNNILLNKIGKSKDIKIEYTFSEKWLDSSKGYSFVESLGEGWLSDVHLGNLRKLTELLQARAEELDFSIFDRTNPTVKIGEKNTTATKSDTEKRDSKPVYLLKRFKESLPSESVFNDPNVLLAIPSEFKNDSRTLWTINSYLPKIFRLNKKEPSSVAFSRELRGVKDQISNAIKAEATGELDELTDTYIEISETFLEILNNFNGNYSFDQARQERRSISLGRNELRWLTGDIHEFVLAVKNANNTEVVKKISSLPLILSIRALKVQDHLLFQESVDFSHLFYGLHHDLKDSNKANSNFFFDRSWRYLKEVADYFVEPAIEDAVREQNTASINSYLSFAKYIISVFQKVLKASFDDRDFGSFQTYLRELNLLFKDSNAQEIDLAKKQVVFGLSSKIFDTFNKNRSSDSIKEFFEAISANLPKDIRELTSLMDSVRNFGAEEFWGWDNWEMTPDEGFHTIDVLGKLDVLYCVAALKALGNSSLDSVKIKPSLNLSALLNADKVRSTLDSIESNPKDWSFVLSEEETKKVDDLKKLLGKIKSEQEQVDAQRVAQSEINESQLKKFRLEMKDSFYRGATVRRMLSEFGLYTSKLEESPRKSIPLFGAYQIDEKAPFTTALKVEYVGWGETYGRSMARSENELILGKLLSQSQQLTPSPSEPLDELKKCLKETPMTKPIIFHTLGFSEFSDTLGSDNFIPIYRCDDSWKSFKQIAGFTGILIMSDQQIPIFEIYTKGVSNKDKLLLFDMQDCNLTQYSPLDDPANRDFVYDVFLIKVSDLNKDDELRKEIAEGDENEKDQAAYSESLRQKVAIKVYQKFNFEVRDGSTLYSFNLKK